MSSLTQTILILFLSLGLAACGGGSGSDLPAGAGGGGDFSGLLTGSYDLYVLSGEHFAGADQVAVSVGEAIADGRASLRVTGIENENGAISGSSGEFIYEIFADRTIQIRMPLLFPDPLLRGGITADGDVAVLSSVAPLSGGWTSEASILILVRAGGSFTPGSLDGVFHTADYARTPLQMVSQVGRTTFSAGGVASFTHYGVNYEGFTVDRSGGTTRGTYGLASDGSFSLDLSVSSLVGGLFRTGDLLITAGEVVAGHAPRISVHTRQASGMSAADMVGDYYIVGFSRAYGRPFFRSMFGTVSMDGVGAATLRYTMNEEGALTDRAYAGTYAVAPDGRFVLETITEKDMRGGVTQSGRFATVGGGLRDSDNAAFYFLVRK